MTIQGSSWINIISKLAGVALRAGEAVADVNIIIFKLLANHDIASVVVENEYDHDHEVVFL